MLRRRRQIRPFMFMDEHQRAKLPHGQLGVGNLVNHFMQRPHHQRNRVQQQPRTVIRRRKRLPKPRRHTIARRPGGGVLRQLAAAQRTAAIVRFGVRNTRDRRDFCNS